MAKKRAGRPKGPEFAAIPNQVFLGLPWKTVRPKYERLVEKLRKTYPLAFVPLITRCSGRDLGRIEPRR